MTAHLTGALAAIIADPDCCAASKAIARNALTENAHNGLSEEAQHISDAEAALDEIVQIAQAAGDYGQRCQPQDTTRVLPGMRYEIYKIDEFAASGTTTDSTTKPVMPELAEAIARLNRSTWDNRTLPRREDVRALLDAYRPLAHPEPPKGRRVWYRGWECYYGYGSVAWTGMGWVACFGGEDLDAITVDARTWDDLLDEIDDHDMTGEMAQPAPYTCKHGCERDVLKDHVAELVQALAPFAAVAECDIGNDETDSELFQVMGKYNRAPRLKVSDFRGALAAHAKAKGGAL